MCDLEVAHHGLGCEVGEWGTKFYDDDGRIMGVDSGWVQEIFGAMVALFKQVGL